MDRFGNYTDSISYCRGREQQKESCTPSDGKWVAFKRHLSLQNLHSYINWLIDIMMARYRPLPLPICLWSWKEWGNKKIELHSLLWLKPTNCLKWYSMTKNALRGKGHTSCNDTRFDSLVCWSPQQFCISEIQRHAETGACTVVNATRALGDRKIDTKELVCSN